MKIILKIGGMLYSNDFLINSDFIIITEINNKFAINNKIDNLYLWTTLDNDIALELYKKQGFYIMGDFYPADGTFNGLNGFHSIMMVFKIMAILIK